MPVYLLMAVWRWGYRVQLYQGRNAPWPNPLRRLYALRIFRTRRMDYQYIGMINTRVRRSLCILIVMGMRPFGLDGFRFTRDRPMIEVQNLVKWYGPTLAVDDLNFSIPHGQIVGFLGPNGAGKSTTLRILTGYLPATSGSVSIDGHDVADDSLAVRLKVGYLPENTPLYPEMRVEEYLDYRGKLQKMDRSTRRSRIDMVCDQCGLAKVRRRLIGQLSRGNRQRVGLAQSLLHDPPVLILDEPTAGLDPQQIMHVRKLIGELRGQHTILLSTHILHEVEKTADRVIIISGGKIVADDTPDELRRSVKSGSRILVDIKADADITVASVAGVFKQIDDVKEVEVAQQDGWCQAVVTPQDGCDAREALGQAIQSNHWFVREISHESASLEEFFVEITAKQDQAGTEAAV